MSEKTQPDQEGGLRYEQEPLLQKRELQEKQESERERVRHLLSDARSWYESRMLRRYLRAAKAIQIQKYGTIDSASRFGQWLVWAEQQADRMDPLVPSPPSVLDEKVPGTPASPASEAVELARHYPPTSGGVVFGSSGRVLLRKPRGSLAWTFAKGKTDRAEVPKTTVVREVRRQLGVSGTIPEGGPFRKFLSDNVAYLFYLVLLTEQHADFDRAETHEVAWLTLEGAQERIAATAHEAASREDLVTLKLAGQAFVEEGSRPKTPKRRQGRGSAKSAK